MGRSEITDPRKQRLLDWLLTSPKERDLSQRQLAAEIGVDARTLREWKQEEGFYAIWQQESRKMAGGPERTQAVLDELYSIATSESEDTRNSDRVSAAKVFLGTVKELTPEAKATKAITAYTDAELEAMIAEAAQKLHHERTKVAGTA